MTVGRGLYRGVVLACLVGSLAAAFLFGCASSAPHLGLTEDLPWSSLCARLQRSWAGLNTFESDVRVSIESRMVNFSGFGKVAYSSAGVLAARLRGPLGVRAVDLYAYGDSVVAYVPVENTVYFGRASTGQGKPLAKWTETLLGRPPLPCGGEAQIRPYGSRDLRIVIRDQLADMLLLVDREKGDVSEMSVQPAEGVSFEVEYEDRYSSHGLRLPRLVRATSQSPPARLTLSYLEPRVNTAIDWSRYRLRIPHSARWFPLEELPLPFSTSSGKWVPEDGG